MDCTIQVDQGSEQVIPEVLGRLQRQGLHVITTFDFQLARAPHVNCSCPHHGQKGCNCQYAVLLVYEPQSGYAVNRTITVHGRDGQVWLSLLERPRLPTGDARQHTALETKLLEALQDLVPPGQVGPVQAKEDGASGVP